MDGRGLSLWYVQRRRCLEFEVHADPSFVLDDSESTTQGEGMRIDLDRSHHVVRLRILHHVRYRNNLRQYWDEYMEDWWYSNVDSADHNPPAYLNL